MCGSFTGRAPIQVSKITITMFQNGIWLIEYNLIPRKSELYNGIINKLALDSAGAITPSNLLGIDLN